MKFERNVDDQVKFAASNPRTFHRGKKRDKLERGEKKKEPPRFTKNDELTQDLFMSTARETYMRRTVLSTPLNDKDRSTERNSILKN